MQDDMAHDIATAALAAIEAAEGVVVPREATREMRLAGYDRDMQPTECLYTSIYRAMLASSPLAKEPGA
jgi:hypothetical protein